MLSVGRFWAETYAHSYGHGWFYCFSPGSVKGISGIKKNLKDDSVKAIDLRHLDEGDLELVGYSQTARLRRVESILFEHLNNAWANVSGAFRKFFPDCSCLRRIRRNFSGSRCSGGFR